MCGRGLRCRFSGTTGGSAVDDPDEISVGIVVGEMVGKAEGFMLIEGAHDRTKGLRRVRVANVTRRNLEALGDCLEDAGDVVAS